MSLALLAKGGGFWNITDATIAKWNEQYPGLDIAVEVSKANDWLKIEQRKKNEGKMWKKSPTTPNGGFVRWLESARSVDTFHKTVPVKESYWEKRLPPEPEVSTESREQQQKGAWKAFKDIRELLK